ncbi:MAG: hypothetical protein AB7T06_37390 [Kofleriaceae bacterium]
MEMEETVASAPPEPAPPAATMSEMPEDPTLFYGEGGATPEAQAAAYPQYAEDGEMSSAEEAPAEEAIETLLEEEPSSCEEPESAATESVESAAAEPDAAIGPPAPTPGPDADLTPEEIEARTKRLEQKADRLREAQDSGLFDSTDKTAILKEMSGLSPTEAAELEKIYAGRFKDEEGNPLDLDLRKDLRDQFDEDDPEAAFIDATLDGDESAKKKGRDLAIDYIADEADDLITDGDDVNELLRLHGDDPAAAEEFAKDFKAKTGTTIDSTVKGSLDDDEYAEAAANMRGDRATANAAVLAQGDERSKEVIEEARSSPGGLEKLAKETQDLTGERLDDVIAKNDDLSDDEKAGLEKDATQARARVQAKRDAELDAAVAAMSPEERAAADKKAREVASRLSTELSKTHLIGNNTDVTKELQGLSPAEMKLVMDSYKKQNSAIDPDADLERDLREGLDGKDLKVANAALNGDKVAVAAATVEQAADGIGTDTGEMKKAMETLDTEADRKAFAKRMDKDRGGAGGSAYEDLVRDETTSHDRDELNALAIADAENRAGELAAVRVTKTAYGGKYNAIQEGMRDMIGDEMGETAAERDHRRAVTREYDPFTAASNAGGDEDVMLDQMQGLKTPEEIEAFKKKMKSLNEETASETIANEMENHHKNAGDRFMSGHYELGQAERMVADLDNYVDDREDGSSQQLEQVRLSKEQQEAVDKASPADKEKELEKQKALARQSLIEKADQVVLDDAHNLGVTDYEALRKDEMSEAELAVAEDRIEKGKVDEATSLYEAGDVPLGGLGKKTEKFYETMQDKTPKQMDELRKNFEAEHPGVNFDEWVKSKATSDGERRDFDIMLEGNYGNMSNEELDATVSSEDLIKRAKDLEEAARAGSEDRPLDPLGNLRRDLGNEAGNELAGITSNTDERLDARMKRIEELEKKSGDLTPEERKDLIEQVRYLQGDQKAFTDSKNAAANATAEAAGTAVELGVTAATGNDTAAEVAAGATKMMVKDTLNPARYSADEQIADVADTATSVASGAAGDAVKNPVAKVAVESAVNAAGDTIGDTKNLQDAGQAAKNMGEKALEEVKSAAAAEAVDAVSDEVLDAAKIDPTKLQGAKREAAAVTKKTVGVATETVVNGDYDKNAEDLLLDGATKVAKGVAADQAGRAYRRGDPENEVREPTEDELREIEQARAEESLHGPVPLPPDAETLGPDTRVKRPPPVAPSAEMYVKHGPDYDPTAHMTPDGPMLHPPPMNALDEAMPPPDADTRAPDTRVRGPLPTGQSTPADPQIEHDYDPTADMIDPGLIPPDADTREPDLRDKRPPPTGPSAPADPQIEHDYDPTADMTPNGPMLDPPELNPPMAPPDVGPQYRDGEMPDLSPPVVETRADAIERRLSELEDPSTLTDDELLERETLLAEQDLMEGDIAREQQAAP